MEVEFDGRAPLRYWPYHLAGGQQDGRWRLVWMSLAPAWTQTE